jgi:hypothetical protein
MWFSIRKRSQINIEQIRGLWEAGEANRAGMLIYDAMPMAMRPGWAADILEVTCSRLRDVPFQIRNVIEIGRKSKRLREAHDAFSAVRNLTLIEDETRFGGNIYLAVLETAEYAAKVIYNASGVEEPIKPGEHAPFDDDCGYWLVGCLDNFVQICGSLEFKQQAWNTLES